MPNTPELEYDFFLIFVTVIRKLIRSIDLKFKRSTDTVLDVMLALAIADVWAQRNYANYYMNRC